MALPNTQDLSQRYLSLVAAENPNLNPFAKGGDFYVKSFVYGGLLSGIYADVYLKFLNIFAQNLSGEWIDKELASLKLPQRYPAFAAMGTVIPTTAPATTVVIPINSLLAAQGTTFNYLITEELTIASGTQPNIPIISQSLGAGTALAPGAILTLVNPIPGAPTFTVTQMVDGGDLEDDSQCIARILDKIQNPLLGGAKGDFNFWARSVAGVTGSFTLNNVGGQNIVGVYILAGGSNFNSILKFPGTPYSRTANTSLITSTYNFIETKRPATVSFYVSSVNTFQIPANVVNVGVELIPNVTLDTILPGFSFSVRDLIKREVRRAIIETPTGGNRVNSLPYLFASDIADTVGLGLSAKAGITGLYATILLDWNVLLSGGDPNYPLPNGVQSNGNYPYIYDILYDRINVTVLGN